MLAMLAYTGFAQEAVPGTTNYTYDTPPARLRDFSYNMGKMFITANDTNGRSGIRTGANYGIRYQGGRELHKGTTILVGAELQYNLSVDNVFNHARFEYVYVGIPVSIDYETFTKHQGYYVRATISAGLAHQEYFNLHTYVEFDGGLLFAADHCRIGFGPYLQFNDDIKNVQNDNVKNIMTIGLRLSINLR